VIDFDVNYTVAKAVEQRSPLNPPVAKSPSPANLDKTDMATGPASPAADSGRWRVSKLIGVNIYNDRNEKLGDISEILIDKSGKVAGVVVGVGGFLGMGEHNVQVDLGKLKFVDEPIRTSATSSTTVGDASGRSATTTAGGRWDDKKSWPDHAILSGVSKDQLKSMPQFKY
jgi:sporulation protein YlmC with PRC-barrel domain